MRPSLFFVFQLTGDRTEGNRRGGFFETRAWSRVFLRISSNNLPALVRIYIDYSPKAEAINEWLPCITIQGVIKAKAVVLSAECWLPKAKAVLLQVVYQKQKPQIDGLFPILLHLLGQDTNYLWSKNISH